jgi:hypothetical protein
MSSYVVTFRSASARPSAEQEQAWTNWFGEIAPHITDSGNRVGRAVMLGDAAPDQLSGYIVIEAADLDAAVEVAKGCPGLASGGRVEVGETVASS